jgi:hypothetical protein
MLRVDLPGACGTPVVVATSKTIAATIETERDGDDDPDRDEPHLKRGGFP